jgi:hypothetical protein
MDDTMQSRKPTRSVFACAASVLLAAAAAGATAPAAIADAAVQAGECSRIDGDMSVVTGEGRLVVREDLSTELSAHQRLYAWWSAKHRLRLTRLLHASCVVRSERSVFHGVGEAKLDGVDGYRVIFQIAVAETGETTVELHISAPHELIARLNGVQLPPKEAIH